MTIRELCKAYNDLMRRVSCGTCFHGAFISDGYYCNKFNEEGALECRRDGFAHWQHFAGTVWHSKENVNAMLLQERYHCRGCAHSVYRAHAVSNSPVGQDGYLCAYGDISSAIMCRSNNYSRWKQLTEPRKEGT